MRANEEKTLVEILRRRSAEQPERIAYTFLPNGLGEETNVTYRELDRQARRIAAHLAALAPPGERVLLLFPSGIEFVTSFFGCNYAGLTAVPAYPPDPRRLDRTLASLQAIVADCRPAAVLTTEAVLGLAQRFLPQLPDLARPKWIAVDRLADTGENGWQPGASDPESLSFLQYTSGSTGSPKGVMVAHRNVLSNLAVLHERVQQSEESVVVIWLPLYHDMGLIGGILGSMYAGSRCVFMSPLSFLERPLRWLKALSRYRGTHSGAPNTAFDLCSRRVRAADLEQLDLSSWQAVCNGAEPIRSDTIDRFAAAFAPAGFRRDVFLPCYGLAESVLFVAGSGRTPRPVSVRFDGSALGQRLVVPAQDGEGRLLVACGEAAGGHDLVIADPDSHRPCADGQIGEVWVRGPSVARGYWGRPGETAEMFGARLADGEGPFLRTGDLGFFWQEQLYVSGRIKDLIIIRGRNYYPQDLERTVEESHPAIRRSGCAAFSIDDGGERLVVVCEVSPGADPARAQEIFDAVRSEISNAHELRIEGIGLLPAKTLPKTSSGKVRRQACREGWASGKLELIARWDSRPTTHAVEASAPPPAAQVTAAVAGGNGSPPPVEPVETLEAAGRRAEVEKAIHALVVRALGEEGAEVGVEEPLTRLGLDSVAAAELKASVEDELGIDVSPALLLAGASIRELATLALTGDAPPAPTAKPLHRFERFVNPELGSFLRQIRMDKRFVRGDGCWLFDAEGNRYLDSIAGFGAVPFGHAPAAIWQAIRAVGESGEPNFVQPSSLEAAGQLAERLLGLAPPGLRYVTFTNSGAESAEAAIKLVRAATNRPLLLSTHDGFHGKTLGALSATGRLAYQEPFFAPVPGFEHVPFGDAEALERYLEQHQDQVAAFLVEPIQGEGGIVQPPAGYLKAVRELCTRFGVKLVLDEIQTGFGRTGRMFVCEEEGVTPDVLLLAKALGGGVVPVGAVLYTEDCYTEKFASKHSSTFAGNTLSCRVGLAALDLLTADNGSLLANVREMGRRLREGLEGLQRKYPELIREVRGRGFLLGVELTNERAPFGRQCLLGALAEQRNLAAMVCSYLLEVEHIRLAPTLLASSVLRIEPPLIFTAEMCDLVVAGLDRALEHLAHRDTAGMLNHLMVRPRPALPRPARRAIDDLPTPRPGDGGEGRWAFVIHPIDSDSYAEFDRSLGVFSSTEIRELCDRWGDIVDPFVGSSTRVVSAAGAVAYGEFVVLPWTTRELVEMPHGEAVREVRRAVELARDRGAQIVGLGGFASVVTGGGIDLGDVGVALTTGNSYTAVAAVEAARNALSWTEMGLDEATVAVVGAAGSVGRAAALLLAEEVRRLILVGNPAHPGRSVRLLREVALRAVQLADERPGSRPDGPIASAIAALRKAGETSAEAIVDSLIEQGLLILTTDAPQFLPLAELVVTATSSLGGVVGPTDLKSGAIACDLSRPFNVAKAVQEQRPDVLVIEGGVVEVPGPADLGWDFGLIPGTAYACMCETMLLALERRYGDAPPGAEVSREMLRALSDSARRHGFRIAGMHSFGSPVTEDVWSRVRKARHSFPESTAVAFGESRGLGGEPKDWSETR